MPFGTPLVDVAALEKRIRELPLTARLTLASQLIEFDPKLAASILEDVVAELRAANELRK